MHRRDFIVGGVLAGLAAQPVLAAQPIRIDVAEKGLVGRLYVPPKARRRAAVLMLGGSGGGYPDDKAAMSLAEAGVPVLALAYFRGWSAPTLTTLPEQLRDIPL